MTHPSHYARAVIKRQGPEISPGYYERGPQLLTWENRRKIEPKEIPSCFLPRLLVVFTRQLEILVTSLYAQHRKCSSLASVTHINKQIHICERRFCT